MKKEMILTLARDIPIFSTEQVARFFSTNGSPSKRASETLRRLEDENLIEGKRREIGKSKIWRLSSIGRKSLGIVKPPLAFNTPKIEHVLGIGDIYLDLVFSNRLACFQYEPRDEFEAGRKMYYCPDAFFILKDPYAAYLLELQRSPLSSSRWAAKWAVASAFFDGDYYKKASWQVLKNKVLKPKILAITGQETETVNAGSSLPLVILKNISPLI